MKRGFTLLMAILAICGTTYPSAAQVGKPYLKSAMFYLSVDHWADIWINDVPVIESQPRTPFEKGYQSRKALLSTLCLLRGENILAIEVDDSTRPPDPNNDYVGIAYVLQLDFSDGTRKFLTSAEAGDHRAYYIPDNMMGHPRGWQRLDFNDASWGNAQNTGTSLPGLATVDNPLWGGSIPFLSTVSLSPKAQHVGEQHLFRRKFYLELSPNPYCRNSKVVPRVQPVIVPRPSVSPQGEPPQVFPRPTLLPAIAPRPTSTATAVITRIAPFIVSAPQALQTPLQASGPIVPAPVLLKETVTLTPLPTSSLSYFYTQWLSLITPTPTSTPDGSMSPTATLATGSLLPTPTFNATTAATEGQTIVFDSAPANIYISFADGPGVYRLEIFDKSGRHVKTFFEQKVVAESDAWAEWDGKNDSGQAEPPGEYSVIYSRNGKELKRMTVLKSMYDQGTDQNEKR